MDGEKKCFLCGRPATRELLDILDKRTLDICDLYPLCASFKQVKETPTSKKEEKEK